MKVLINAILVLLFITSCGNKQLSRSQLLSETTGWEVQQYNSIDNIRVHNIIDETEEVYIFKFKISNIHFSELVLSNNIANEPMCNILGREYNSIQSLIKNVRWLKDVPKNETYYKVTSNNASNFTLMILFYDKKKESAVVYTFKGNLIPSVCFQTDCQNCPPEVHYPTPEEPGKND